MAAEKNEKWIMTNGNHRTRGWENTEEGFWTPSLHDRRRLTTAGLGLVAENYGGMIPGPLIYKVISLNSKDSADQKVLTEMVMAQMQQG